MKCHARRLESFGALPVCLGGCLLLVGCGSPPSVLPLLEVAERVARDEAAHLEADIEREAHWLDQTRAALESAYQRDLDQRAMSDTPLDAPWVMDATRAYVLAREELMVYEMDRREQLHRRRDNLHAVADATHRAAAILKQQDDLITQAIGGRVWDLLRTDDSRAARH